MYKKWSLILVLCLLLTGCGKKESDTDCLIKSDDLCITKISSSYAVDGNYWDGAREICGGIKNMPKASDLTKIAGYVYEGHPRFPADELKKGLKPIDVNFKMFDKNRSGSFYIFSEETENAKKYAYIRSYYHSQTDWTSVESNSANSVLAVCVKHR